MTLKKILIHSSVCLLTSLTLVQNVAAQGPKPIGTTLADFYQAALASNPRLNISLEHWNINSARKDMATGQLLPNISLTAGLSDNDQTKLGQTRSYDGERYGIQLSQVLFNWQAITARSQASLLEDQTEAEYYAQVSALMTEVADLYLNVLQNEDALSSVTAQLEAMSNQVDQLQALFDRQLIQITELYEGKARLAQIQSEHIITESNLTLARESLRALTTIEAGELNRLPEQITVTPLQGTMDEWLNRTRSNNLIIAARAYAYQAAQKRVSGSRGAYLPQVSLVVQQQNSNLGFDNQLIDDYETFYVGVNLSMSLYAGGRNKAGVREAQSMRSIAQNELQQAQLDMVESARTAFLQVKSGEARIAAAQVLAESTEAAYTAMQRGFELGTVTSVDLLNALRDRFQSERELHNARYDHIRATLKLRREAGVLSADDLMDISDLLEVPIP